MLYQKGKVSISLDLWTSISNLLNKVKKTKQTQTNKKPKPNQCPKTSPGWFYETWCPTGLKTFSLSQSDLLEGLWSVYIRVRIKKEQCAKMGYDPNQSLYTAVLSLANPQNFSLFRPTCWASPSCLVTCPPALDGSIVFMGLHPGNPSFSSAVTSSGVLDTIKICESPGTWVIVCW